MKRPLPSCGNLLRSFSDGRLQVGQGIAQTVGVRCREVKPVALPVQFDTVPVGQVQGFGDVLQPVAANFWNGHIPGGGEPTGGLIRSEAPVGVLFT